MMREATTDDIATHQTLTFDELRYLVPEWVLAKNHFPPDAEYYLPQVEWCGENVCIRGINRDTHELMIDCGFDRVYWIGETDEAPRFQFVAYRLSTERAKAARLARRQHARRSNHGA